MTNETPVIVVLGASGGIGSALTRRLADRGARLVLGGRRQAPLEALAKEVEGQAVIHDARTPGEVERVVSHATETFGRLDGLANCVGSLLLKPAHLTKQAEWDDVIATNLRSSFEAVSAAARAMTRSGGSVVLVSSAAARLGLAHHEAIAAAKAGIIGLALSAAATYAARGIRINVVAPGLVRTPLTERITSNAGAEKASLAMHALGRLGEPDDVASLMSWLLDPAQSWVTGQVMGVDGGLATVRTRSG